MKMPFHQEQLEFMIHLARNRVEFLDPVFRFLAYFDSPYFFFVLIPVIWIGFSYQWGLRIFYWFTLNNLINSYAKYLIGWPRPSTDLPEIGMQHPHSFGFPSGGAQTCLFLGTILIYYWRTPAAWIIGISYILIISFSRLYLGVHYPLDVLGGWIIALLLVTLLIKSKEPLEKFLAKRGLLFCLILTLAIPLILMRIVHTSSIYYIMGSVMGVGVGSYFSLKYHLFLPWPHNLNEGIGRSFIGIALIFLMVSLWPSTQSFAKSFVTGLLMSLVASPVCRWFIDFKLHHKE